jgi:hypothetical protein
MPIECACGTCRLPAAYLVYDQVQQVMYFEITARHMGEKHTTRLVLTPGTVAMETPHGATILG